MRAGAPPLARAKPPQPCALPAPTPPCPALPPRALRRLCARSAIVSNQGNVLALEMQPMEVTPGGSAVDLYAFTRQTAATVESPRALTNIRHIWDKHFAAVVSPWLAASAETAKGDTMAAAVAVARRDLDAILAGAQQVLLGLAHMGERGLVHRDVKPQNIMLHDGVFTLVDLGFACVFRTAWDTKEKVNEQQCVLPRGKNSLAANWKCLLQLTNSHNGIGPAGKAAGIGGTPGYISPAMLPVELKLFDGTSSAAALGQWCVFNRHACVGKSDPEDVFAGSDAFGVGMMLLQLLAGAPEKSLLDSVRFGFSKSLAKENFYDEIFRSALLARFLALDDVSDKRTPDNDVAAASVLRKEVRVRTRALLEAAVAAGGDGRRSFMQYVGNAFTNQPASAAGIATGDANHACVRRTLLANVDELSKVVEKESNNFFKICTWSDETKSCSCEPQAKRDAAPVDAAKQAVSSPGTDALLDLLTNLLSPSKTLGLAPEKTTLLALADSVDSIRTQLYEQWNLAADAKDGLKRHFAAVEACAESEKCGKSGRTVSTVAGASAHCRWKNLNTMPREKVVEETGNDEVQKNNNENSRSSYLQLLLAGTLANLINIDNDADNIASGSMFSSHGSVKVFGRQPTGEYDAAKHGAEIVERYNLDIPNYVTVLAAVTSVTKSDHKPWRWRRAWAKGKQVRHLVLTRDGEKTILRVYENVAKLKKKTKKGKKQKMKWYFLQMIENGQLFGGTNQNINTLSSQGTPCNEFLGANQQNENLVKLVRVLVLSLLGAARPPAEANPFCARNTGRPTKQRCVHDHVLLPPFPFLFTFSG